MRTKWVGFLKPCTIQGEGKALIFAEGDLLELPESAYLELRAQLSTEVMVTLSPVVTAAMVAEIYGSARVEADSSIHYQMCPACRGAPATGVTACVRCGGHGRILRAVRLGGPSAQRP